VLSAIAASSTSTGILMAIGGILAVIAISAVFYVVGRGEDRDREQAAAARAAAAEGEQQPEPEPEERQDHSHQPPASAEPHPRLSRPARTRKRG
jgi:hypothetical protein